MVMHGIIVKDFFINFIGENQQIVFPRYLNVLTQFRDSIDEVRIEGHTSSLWNHRSTPEEAYFNNMALSQGRTRAVLEYTGDLSAAGQNKLRESFEQMGNGPANAGRILPVPLGFKLTPMDIKLTDAQYLELKKYGALQLAAAFGIKPNQLNDYERGSYANSEQQTIAFQVETMQYTIKQ